MALGVHRARVAVFGCLGLADPKARRRWAYDGPSVGDLSAPAYGAPGTVLPARPGRAPATGAALPEKDSM